MIYGFNAFLTMILMFIVVILITGSATSLNANLKVLANISVSEPGKLNPLLETSMRQHSSGAEN